MNWIEDVYNKEFSDILDREILLARSKSFRKIFQYLIDLERDFYHIVETGSIRAWDQWGDGQSTRLFDSFVNFYDGYVTTIDINEDCTRLTHNNTSDKVEAINGNSLEVLPKIENCADLLYLDSFDFVEGKELESGLHHLYELVCSNNIIDTDTLIAVDDTDENGEGKGKFVLDFIKKANFKIIVNEGRQLAFTMEINK